MIVVDGVEMVDVQEAATLSRRTPETIRRWVWSGRVTSVKNGNKLFVRRADLAVGETAEGGRALSLSDWVELLPATTAHQGGTAADLVLEDRAARAGR